MTLVTVLFRRLLPSFFQADDCLAPDEKAVRHDKAVLLCCVCLAFLVFFIGLNILEGTGKMLPSLFLAAVWVSFLLVLVRRFRCSLFALTGAASAAMILGGYIILSSAAPTLGSLFWFVLFPPMMLFCLGLRLGSCFTACALVGLLILFGPLQHTVVIQISDPARVRFLAAMVGISFFAGLAEYAREKAQRSSLRAAQTLERCALTDALTGLGNRRDFQNHFLSLQALALRAGRCFSVVLIDIDRFKLINDTHGHGVGDQALCHVTQVILRNLRQGDTLFRWGGEEFVALMPETDGQSGLACAERLRAAVESSPFAGAKNIHLPMTVSLGVFCAEASTSMDEYLTGADRRLYRAKANGRNRVEG